ncbi:MAG: DUF1385 domain-containing protein [Agathobacter sp.]|nr:DUF1385 domain-containing protein [Agathobacter sp.]
MKYSGIGGQAVMEGVMMKNDSHYAVAVRKPDEQIEIKVDEYKGFGGKLRIKKWPIFRGIFAFIDSLYLGMSTLMFSASFFEEEESTTEKKDDSLAMGATVALSVLMALAIFFVLPYGLSTLFSKVIDSDMLVALIEGVIRMLIFVGYVVLISFMEDIKRVFMYHGAEHKCINCIEHGLELNVENVKASSKQHKRCGTSFLIIVMLISIIFFMFIRVDSKVLRLVLRLILIPVIAGVSFEFIRIAGRYDNKLVNIISKPGMWMQNLTTKEPDDKMIEVGIASVEAVFDWKKWQKEEL